MKSLTAITGNMDDMDQTVLSIEEYARLMSNLGDLRLENIRLKQQLQALAEAGAASEDMQLMRLGYAAAAVENEDLRARVQELGELARNNNSRRVVELEAQLEAIGAGGVEPLRKRHDHIEVSLRMVTKGGRSMTTQHAPGPWTANTQTTRIQVNSRNVTVAHVMGIDAKAQADAYLMAAAPELLAALKGARRKLAWFTDSYPQDIVVSESEFFEPIDAAIAKAEGV